MRDIKRRLKCTLTNAQAPVPVNHGYITRTKSLAERKEAGEQEESHPKQKHRRKERRGYRERNVNENKRC